MDGAKSELRKAFKNAKDARKELGDKSKPAIHVNSARMLLNVPVAPEYKAQLMDRKGHPAEETDMSDLKVYQGIENETVQSLLKQIAVARGANTKAVARVEMARDRNAALSGPLAEFTSATHAYRAQATQESAYAANLWAEYGRREDRATQARTAEIMTKIAQKSPRLEASNL